MGPAVGIRNDKLFFLLLKNHLKNKSNYKGFLLSGSGVDLLRWNPI